MANHNERDVRVQLDVSREARHNLRRLAAHLDCTMSEALDLILVRDFEDIQCRHTGPLHDRTSA